MARLEATRDAPHPDASPDPKGHGRHSKAGKSLRRVTSNRAGGRCDIPTPTTPASLSCTDTEPMPSSVESGRGPLVRGGTWGTKRRVDFAIGDDESDASGSESMRSKAYGAMQTRIKDAKNKKKLHPDKAEAAKPGKSSTNQQNE